MGIDCHLLIHRALGPPRHSPAFPVSHRGAVRPSSPNPRLATAVLTPCRGALPLTRVGGALRSLWPLVLKSARVRERWGHCPQSACLSPGCAWMGSGGGVRCTRLLSAMPAARPPPHTGGGAGAGPGGLGEGESRSRGKGRRIPWLACYWGALYSDGIFGCRHLPTATLKSWTQMWPAPFSHKWGN
jgi:hypothetical protein